MPQSLDSSSDSDGNVFAFEEASEFEALGSPASHKLAMQLREA
jgi:hypothetical protein